MLKQKHPPLRLLRWTLLIATLLTGPTTHLAGASAPDPTPTEMYPSFCSESSAVSAAACRVHREAVYSVGSSIGAASVKLKQTGVEILPGPPLGRKSRYVEFLGEQRERLVGHGATLASINEFYRRAAAYSAMDLVQSHLSSALYAFESFMDRTITHPLSPDAALTQGVGICGHHVETFRAILAKLNIPTRPVQFWWRTASNDPRSHIAVEVEIDGRWEMFDVTWGATFLAPDNSDRLLSATEARRSKPTPAVNRNNASYRLALVTDGEPFAYLNAGVDMTINNAGAISLRSKQDSESGLVADLQHIPNFVGDAEQDNKGTAGTYYVTVDLEGHYDVSIQISSVAGCASSMITVGGRHLVPKAGNLLFAGIAAPMQIKVTGEDDICYAVIDRIGFRKSG